MTLALGRRQSKRTYFGGRSNMTQTSAALLGRTGQNNSTNRMEHDSPRNKAAQRLIPDDEWGPVRQNIRTAQT